MHQAAGGVVDIDKQGGLWAAVFEPPVLGAVDLHQLTQTIAPRPRLVDALYSVLAPNPEPGADIYCRNVSIPRSRPCSSDNFSAAKVGPKST